jgi:hypothetical protein
MTKKAVGPYVGPDHWQKLLRTAKVRGGRFCLITPAVWLRLPCWVPGNKAKECIAEGRCRRLRVAALGASASWSIYSNAFGAAQAPLAPMGWLYIDVLLV